MSFAAYSIACATATCEVLPRHASTICNWTQGRRRSVDVDVVVVVVVGFALAARRRRRRRQEMWA